MKQGIILFVLTLIAGIVFAIYRLDGPILFAVLIVGCIVWYATLTTYIQFNVSLRSYLQPSTISQCDAGKMYVIERIIDGRVGLNEFGYTHGGIGANHDKPTMYYLIENIPLPLREVGIIFKVTHKLEFQKVKINGYKDKSKEPFEIVPERYIDIKKAPNIRGFYYFRSKSEGIRQSPLGERATDPTFGPSGIDDLLNWF